MAVRTVDYSRLLETMCYTSYEYHFTKEKTKGYELLYLAEILNIEKF